MGSRDLEGCEKYRFERNMRDGRAGLGHPPWQGGGGGQAEAKGGVEGGSERPEAGCLGEYRDYIGIMENKMEATI